LLWYLEQATDKNSLQSCTVAGDAVNEHIDDGLEDANKKGGVFLAPIQPGVILVRKAQSVSNWVSYF
jgi:hypothetical protein